MMFPFASNETGLNSCPSFSVTISYFPFSSGVTITKCPSLLLRKALTGRPVRALRSNKLGHFVIVTPLENGKYEIVTEKDGHEFSPVSFEANGNIIPPILVSGKNLHPEIL